MDPKKILIVDDEEEVLAIMIRKLDEEGFRVFSATSGEGALQKAKEEIPDAILMDIVLPDIDGAEVVRLLQADPVLAHIPVIFLSGIVSGMSEGAGGTIRIGEKVYPAIGKPFSFQDVLQALMELF